MLLVVIGGSTADRRESCVPMFAKERTERRLLEVRRLFMLLRPRRLGGSRGARRVEVATGIPVRGRVSGVAPRLILLTGL